MKQIKVGSRTKKEVYIRIDQFGIEKWYVDEDEERSASQEFSVGDRVTRSEFALDCGYGRRSHKHTGVVERVCRDDVCIAVRLDGNKQAEISHIDYWENVTRLKSPTKPFAPKIAAAPTPQEGMNKTREAWTDLVLSRPNRPKDRLWPAQYMDQRRFGKVQWLLRHQELWRDWPENVWLVRTKWPALIREMKVAHVVGAATPTNEVCLWLCIAWARDIIDGLDRRPGDNPIPKVLMAHHSNCP